MANCTECQHYKRNADLKSGLCLRYPPEVVVLPTQTPMGQVQLQCVSMFPTIDGGAICGEFRGKKNGELVQ